MSDITNDDGSTDKVPAGEPAFQPVGGPEEAEAIKSQAQRAARRLEDKVKDLGESVTAAVATATDQAKDLYAHAAQRYDDAAAQIDPFVRERPYTAIGIAAAAGLLVGLLWAGRGSKVVYLKTRT
jgi:ElaB/YqjD/DUF883 family membrane-anchored ribosome-binding protein